MKGFICIFLVVIIFSFGFAQVSVDKTRISILCYHHLDLNPKYKTPYTVDSGKFIEQIEALQAEGFTFISLKDVEDFYYKHKVIPEKSAVITFDDGNHNTYTIAYPLLKKRHIPFAVFVYPSAIGVGHDRGFANWADVKEMADNGVIIGCHAFDHPFLTRPGKSVATKEQYDKWLKNELANSKAIIESKISKNVDYFAVPFGAFDAYVDKALKIYGYKLALNVDGGNNGIYSEPLNLNRSFVMKDDSVKAVVSKTNSSPIYFDSTFPNNLERINNQEFTISFRIKNLDELKLASITLLFAGNRKENLVFDKNANTFSAKVKVFKESYYGVSVAAEGNNGKPYRGNWIFQYNCVVPSFLK